MTICRRSLSTALFRGPQEEFIEDINDWGGIAAGGLEIIELPSDPGGIFIEPYMQTLAERLREHIDQAVSPVAEIADPPEPVLK
ncbi:MAG TPA: hypothetical protein VGW37_09015 [Terriglobia bacterium]|nr:hypothetical protein [Terriglobia bacterium]